MVKYFHSLILALLFGYESKLYKEKGMFLKYSPMISKFTFGSWSHLAKQYPSQSFKSSGV